MQQWMAMKRRRQEMPPGRLLLRGRRADERIKIVRFGDQLIEPR